MSLIKRMRKQKAIWWERGDPDRFGKFTYASAVEIDCRWDDTSQDYLAGEGETRLSNALVYVDRIMSVGDYLQKGEMDSNTGDDPREEDDTFEIHRFDQNPNLRATEFLLTAYL